MFHAIIYDNRASKGFTFYENTPNFPTAFRAPIENICNQYSEPATDNSSVRYAALGEGAYLLSVVFRVSASEHQQRRHFRIVNFLMDRAVAEDFFSTPFCTEALVDFAHNCYLEKLQGFSGNWDAYRRRCSSTSHAISGAPNIKPEILYSCFLSKSSQVFVGMENSCDADINYLLNTLPYAMRPSLSFLIGMETAMECNRIRFNFGSIDDINRLQSNNYDGCAGMNKLTLFVHDGTITSTGVGPNQTERQLAAKLLKLISEPYYPVLRYLIRNRNGLISATEDLSSHLKSLRSMDVSMAIGKAESNNEISADVARAFRQLSAKSQKNPANFFSGLFAPAPAPVQNPGRNNRSSSAAASDKSSVQSPSTELPQAPAPTNSTPPPVPGGILKVEPKETLDDLDGTTMRPDNLLQGGGIDGQACPASPKAPAPPPKPQQPTHQNPSGSGQKQKGHAQSGQPPKASPAPWLLVVLLGLIALGLILILNLKVSTAPSGTLGIYIVSVDGVVSLFSNILSFLCGGITFYALTRLFGHKRK